MKEKLKKQKLTKNLKSHIPLHKSHNSGITLVALIITIIVLLILAVVAIRAVQGDGIISKAKEAQTKYEDAQDEEEIKLALNEWKIVGATTNKTFAEFMAEKFGADKVQAGSSENEVIVTLANGSQYKVTEDGTITSIIREPVNISKGSFVEYKVAYTDIYNSCEYTSTNGWRLLDYTDNGDGTLSNVKLISTGIPAKLIFYLGDTTNSSWYVTDNTQLTNFRNVLTNNGTEDYTFYTGQSTYYALQASAGMYYNFGDIKFACGSNENGSYENGGYENGSYENGSYENGSNENGSNENGEINRKNLGYFTKITSNGTTYDSTNTTETTGANLFLPRGVNASVRLLTLPEMNKMLGRTDIDSINTMSDPTGASGLFVLNNLKNVPGMSANTYDSSAYYWLASPSPLGVRHDSYISVGYDGYVNESNEGHGGVRPVVCLTSNIQLLDTNGDSVLEIK